MVGDQYDGAAFAERARERSYEILGCMHVDSCEWIIQENTLKDLSHT